MSQFIIGHIMTFHRDILNNEHFKKFIDLEATFMMENYLDYFLQINPKLIFSEYFNEAYFQKPNIIDKYIEDNYGDIDLSKLYDVLGKFNDKEKIEIKK